MPSHAEATVPVPMAAEPAAIMKIAERLLAAKFPVLLAEYVGRHQEGFHHLVALAETVGAAVYDRQRPAQFPQPPRPQSEHGQERLPRRRSHPFSRPRATGKSRPTSSTAPSGRRKPLYPANCDMIELGFGDIGLSKWSMDFTRMPNCSLRVLGDTLTAIPELTKLCKNRINWGAGLADRIAKRTADIGKRHDALFAKWADQSRGDWDASPISLPRLAHELWDVIKTEDWVLTACTLQDWALKLWDFDKPYRHAGRALGTGTQIGVSLGVALAHRGTGRLVVDIQPRRRPDVRCRRLVDGGEEQHPVPHRDVQQPRLLQRLGAPDPRRRASRHAGGAAPISARTSSARSPISPSWRSPAAGMRRGRSCSPRTSPAHCGAQSNR